MHPFALRSGAAVLLALAPGCEPTPLGPDAGGSRDALETDAPPHDAASAEDAPALDAARPIATGVVIGPRSAPCTPSGPVTLTSGARVRGLCITSPSGPCIRGAGVSDVVIEDNVIGPCGPDDDPEGNGVDLQSSDEVIVRHNAFDRVASALYALEGGRGLVFSHNRATRIRGPAPRGQLVQFNRVHGERNRIVCNVSDNTTPGYAAGPIDHVNMFDAGGTADSPIEIAFNRIRGGGPRDDGGGLLAGDFGSEHITIHDNVLVSPGQYGIAVAGGFHLRLVDNVVYAPEPFPWSNVGMYVWDYLNPTDDPTNCGDIEASRNRVHYVNREGVRNDWWFAGNCGPIAGADTNVSDDDLDASIWDAPWPSACEEPSGP